jgi:type IV secretory pathway ATPase VirB11/archaellum biosynthesis ATPase
MRTHIIVIATVLGITVLVLMLLLHTGVCTSFVLYIHAADVIDVMLFLLLCNLGSTMSLMQHCIHYCESICDSFSIMCCYCIVA